jgi:enoyl-CoA hydratase
VDAAEALAMGLVNEIAADPLARALELAEALAAVPQATMLSDREAALAAQGLPLGEGLALEARLGRDRIGAALEGARRFADRE